MSWTLEKEFQFEASHILPDHDGKCARLHGHSWRGRLICKGTHLHESGPKSGMLIDFADMKSAIKKLLDEHLDHYHLNESLEMRSPTSELVAKWIFDRARNSLPTLSAVVIEETCTSRCTYAPEAK